MFIWYTLEVICCIFVIIYLTTVLTSTRVLTDPSIRLCSVYKTILPPAPRIQLGFQQLLSNKEWNQKVNDWHQSSKSFLTFGTMWRYVVSVTLLPIYPQGTDPLSNGTKEWDTEPAGRVWKRGISVMLSGIKPQVFGCINHKLITTTTKLTSYWKRSYWYHSKNRMRLLELPWPIIPSGI
jgi:hypothetical protein